MYYSIYSDVDKDFDNLLANSKHQLLQKQDLNKPVDAVANDDIEQLFIENKQPITEEQKPQAMLVHDYYGGANKKVNTNATKDPMSKGFDIRAFRIKQAAMREREATTQNKGIKPGSKGFGSYA